MKRRLSRYANIVREVKTEQWRLELFNDMHESWTLCTEPTREAIESKARDFAQFSGLGVTFYGKPFIERAGKNT